jgi:hypothetical protein
VDLAFDFSADRTSVGERSDVFVRPVYDPIEGDVLYSDARDQLYLACGDRIRGVCDPVKGITWVSVEDPRADDLWLLSHPFLTLPLLETLKRHELFSVHAAGLARQGRGVLLAGTSGSGKTTLAIALARAGFELLGDDMLFLSTTGDGVRVHAFPDEVDVTDATLGFFPELRELLRQRRPEGWPKWSFRPETVFGATTTWSCEAAALVFPCISPVDKSRLEPMDGVDATLELAPNILLTQSQACQAHLAALSALTSTTPCYRLWTGRDFDDLPYLMAKLLD